MRAHATHPRRLAAVPEPGPDHTVRTCWCGWSAVRPSDHGAEIAWATHRVEDHATAAEREAVAGAVMEWEDTFAAIGEDLPARLLPAIVAQTLSLAPAAAEGVAA